MVIVIGLEVFVTPFEAAAMVYLPAAPPSELKFRAPVL